MSKVYVVEEDWSDGYYGSGDWIHGVFSSITLAYSTYMELCGGDIRHHDEEVTLSIRSMSVDSMPCMKETLIKTDWFQGEELI